MPRRGPGPKCSPASSPALSYSTGLRLTPSWGSSTDLVLQPPVFCTAALIVLALYVFAACAMGWLLSVLSQATVAKLLLASTVVCRSHYASLFLLAAGVAFMYGGELLEVIRNMKTPGMDADGLEPAEMEYVLALGAAVAGLERMPPA